VTARRPVGLVLPNNEPGGAAVLRQLPGQAEEWGYDSLWVTDHVVGVRAMAGVYGSYWLEALTSLTWIAARTSTIRLGTGILVVPHRDPVLTAKMIATLDVLSGGRIDLGIGTGWSRVEFRALGAGERYAARGRATDEALDIMCRCWAGGEIAHDGEFFSFRHIEFEPMPLQQPRVPIWVGGDSPAALRRAARFADVWHPHDLAPDALRERGDRLDDEAGRAIPRSVRLAVGPGDLARLADVVDAYTEAGCVRVVIEFRSQRSAVAVDLAEKAAVALFG
jgi:probable F420-dependent oxidoreductase